MYFIIIIGFIIGILYFIIFENAKPSNSFITKCWIRKQPDYLVHNKCYIIGVLLIFSQLKTKYKEYGSYVVFFVGSTWIGLHLAQDIAERYHMKKHHK